MPVLPDSCAYLRISLFQFFLSAVKHCIATLCLHQGLVISTFFYFSAFQIIDPVSRYDIFQTVGNDDHILFFGKYLDVLHNNLFTFNIDVAGGFIEDVNVFICHKIYSQCQSLLLSAGDIGCILGNALVQPTVFFYEFPQIHFL